MIEGLIDLRGDIIPVVDLHKRFQLPTPESYIGTRILIAEVQDYIFGLIVDKVEEVCTFPLVDFAPPPIGSNQAGQEFTVGVARKNQRLLMYLDVERLLNVEQLLKEVA